MILRELQHVFYIYSLIMATISIDTLKCASSHFFKLLLMTVPSLCDYMCELAYKFGGSLWI